MPLSLVIAVIVIGYLLLRLMRLRRFIYQLTEQTRERRHFLFLESGKWARRYGLDQLTSEINNLIDVTEASSRQSEGYFNQIETTLTNLAEAVLLVNADSEIMMANPAACQLLSLREDYRGLRLESVMTSSSFLDYMHGLRNNTHATRRSIELIRGRSTLYFEVVGAEVSDPYEDDRPMTLFVLHDITRMKELEGMRKDFVANVSHELRTPVTVIKGFAEAMIDDYDRLSDADRLKFLDKVKRNADRLHALLEDLLLLSRLETSRKTLKREICTLEGLLSETLDALSERFREGGIATRVSVDPAIGPVMLDPIKIHQVIQNVCDNTVRYAKGATQLVIECRLVDDQIAWHFSDDGCGIPELDIPHIFERFYRVDKGRSRELGGTGLGLSIVKHIISLHGGEVQAQNRSNGGLELMFRMPYHPAARPQPLDAIAS